MYCLFDCRLWQLWLQARSYSPTSALLCLLNFSLRQQACTVRSRSLPTWDATPTLWWQAAAQTQTLFRFESFIPSLYAALSACAKIMRQFLICDFISSIPQLSHSHSGVQIQFDNYQSLMVSSVVLIVIQFFTITTCMDVWPLTLAIHVGGRSAVSAAQRLSGRLCHRAIQLRFLLWWSAMGRQLDVQGNRYAILCHIHFSGHFRLELAHSRSDTINCSTM